jgi:hypothetical protein
MRLLFVHGRAQEEKSSEIIEDEWMKAFRRGLKLSEIKEPVDLKIDVPFYGKELKKLVDAYDLPPGEDLETRGGTIPDDYAEFLREVALEAREKNTVSSADVDREMGTEPEIRGPENWRWVQAVIRVIDSLTPDVSSVSIGILLRDVFIYVNSGTVRGKINEIVQAKMTDDPTIVVGHSLGSVVAYQVLRERQKNTVPRYITVGSPLGIHAIRRRLRTPLTMPGGVADWFNARDTRDVVALYPLDQDNFAVDPPVRNFNNVNNHTGNHHGIDGYLDDLNVVRAICETP